jgi:predicted Zn-ribbon and HTH transcriptional regulator
MISFPLGQPVFASKTLARQGLVRLMPTLFCPKCGYNLTGLPENRCPECGTTFDPAKVEASQRRRCKPISLGRVLLRLLLPPAAFLVVLVSASIGPGRNLDKFIAVALVSAIVFVLVAFVNAMIIARRLAVTGTWNPETGTPIQRSSVFIGFCSLGLFFCQIATACCGCALSGVL